MWTAPHRRHNNRLTVAVVSASAACGASGRTVTIRGMNMRLTLVEGDRVHFDTHAHVTRGSIILFHGAAGVDIPFDVQGPADCVWLLGDNVNGSADSRAHLANGYGGALPTVYIIGVATKIVAPAGRAQRL